MTTTATPRTSNRSTKTPTKDAPKPAVETADVPAVDAPAAPAAEAAPVDPPADLAIVTDLRALADVAALTPLLGQLLGTPDGPQLIAVVLPTLSLVGLDDFATALSAAGAREVPARELDPMWPARTWRMPAGSIELTVTQLATS